jgi:hypothetical protein
MGPAWNVVNDEFRREIAATALRALLGARQNRTIDDQPESAIP